MTSSAQGMQPHAGDDEMRGRTLGFSRASSPVGARNPVNCHCSVLGLGGETAFGISEPNATFPVWQIRGISHILPFEYMH